MPLKNVGNGCWQWGDHGHKYCGPGAKQKAIKQGYAESGGDENKFKSEMKSNASLLNASDMLYMQRLMAESRQKSNRDFLTAVAESFDRLHPTKAYIPEHERERIPEEDFAGPHRSFPIRNSMDVEHAAHLIGHSSDPSKIKNNIIKIAKRKNLTLPESWR